MPPISIDLAALPPRERLMRRIHDSIERHAALVTRREAQGEWCAAGPGVQRKALYRGGGVSARLLKLDADAAVGAGPPDGLEEWVLLEGRLAFGAEVLGSGAWLLADSRTLSSARASGGPATLFSRVVESAPLAPAEAAWWPSRSETPLCHRPAQGEWLPFAPGIELLPLRAAGDVMSMLARFAPGARLPAHAHGLDEHCVMLEGDLFLGDVLLRCGEYQLAPAGSAHGELMSDVGCVLFFHGAVDPALRAV